MTTRAPHPRILAVSAPSSQWQPVDHTEGGRIGGIRLVILRYIEKNGMGRCNIYLLRGSLCIGYMERSSLKEHDTETGWVDEVNYFVADGAFSFLRMHCLLLADGPHVGARRGRRWGADGCGSERESDARERGRGRHRRRALS